MFKSFSPVHTKSLKLWRYQSIPYRACTVFCNCMSSLYLKTSVFVRPRENDNINRLFKKTPFWVPCCLVPENAIYLWTDRCGRKYVFLGMTEEKKVQNLQNYEVNYSQATLVSEYPWCTTKWPLSRGGRLREKSGK